jgi:large subunit ribosomal protein L11
MAKKIKALIKLQIKWGMANPAPPVWPALGQHWVPIGEFTKQFNERTKDKMGKILPTIITVYEDRSFTFITKEPPASVLVKEKANVESGSKEPHKVKVAHLSFQQLKECAEQKMPDLNAVDLAGAMKIMMGAARSAGITTDIDKLTLKELRTQIAKM